MSQTQVIAVLLVAFGLMWALALYLLKIGVSNVLAEVKRIPPREWFDRVEKHMARNHELANEIQKHSLKIEILEDRTTKDHERVGRLEADVSLIDQRVGVLEKPRIA